MSEARKERQSKAPALRGTYGGIEITLPWEKEENDISGAIHSIMSSVFGELCEEEGETLGAVEGVATLGKKIAQKATGRVAASVAPWFGDIADGSALVGTGLWVAGKAGVC